MSDEIAAKEPVEALDGPTPLSSDLLGGNEQFGTDILSGGEVSEEALKALGLEVPKPVETKEKVEGSEAPAPDGEPTEDAKPDGEAKPDGDDAAADAALGKALKEQFASDPLGVVKHLVAALTDEQKHELGLADETAPADEELHLPDDAPDVTDWERGVTSRLNAVPSVVDNRIDARLTQELGRIAPFVDSAQAYAMVALYQMKAMAEATGFPLPDIDMKAVSQKAQAGATWQEAIEAVAGKSVKAAVAKVKQAKVARPTTPGDEGLGQLKVDPGDSMVDIARKMGGLR